MQFYVFYLLLITFLTLVEFRRVRMEELDANANMQSQNRENISCLHVRISM